MKKVAIYGQYIHDYSVKYIKVLFGELGRQDLTICVEESFMEMIDQEKIEVGECGIFTDLDTSYDMLISIGGDGTILRAASLVGSLNVPIIGLNTGNLGFLATVRKDQIKKAVGQLVKGDFSLSKRSLITLSSSEQNAHDKPNNFALNEVSVSRMNTTSMIRIDTWLNEEMLTSYWADGLIISTPTGSTGYSLSCGGPVLSPDAEAFILTPIAPHNLNARPLVIPDDAEIKLVVSGRENEFLASLDNRIASYPNETELILKRADFTIDLVSFPSDSFVKTIRHKLLWGEDRRN